MDLSTIVPGIALMAGIVSATAVGSRLLRFPHFRKLFRRGPSRVAVLGHRLNVEASKGDEKSQTPASVLDAPSVLGALRVNGQVSSDLPSESCSDSARNEELVQVKHRVWDPPGYDSVDPLRPIDGDMGELRDAFGAEFAKEPMREA